MSGVGKAIVCAVGDRTQIAKTEAESTEPLEDEFLTPMQEKL